MNYKHKLCLNHIGHRRKLYLCVTARPMSLLTACGELRCTAILSRQGEKERWKMWIIVLFLSHIRGKEVNCIKNLITLLLSLKQGQTTAVMSSPLPPRAEMFLKMVWNKSFSPSTVNNVPFQTKLHNPPLLDYLRPCLPEKKILALHISENTADIYPKWRVFIATRLTFNGAVLLEEGGRAWQGVRCCGTGGGHTRGACGHDGVARRWVLAPVPIHLHIQQQLILFNTPGETEAKEK